MGFSATSPPSRSPPEAVEFLVRQAVPDLQQEGRAAVVAKVLLLLQRLQVLPDQRELPLRAFEPILFRELRRGVQHHVVGTDEPFPDPHELDAKIPAEEGGGDCDLLPVNGERRDGGDAAVAELDGPGRPDHEDAGQVPGAEDLAGIERRRRVLAEREDRQDDEQQDDLKQAHLHLPGSPESGTDDPRARCRSISRIRIGTGAAASLPNSASSQAAAARP